MGLPLATVVLAAGLGTRMKSNRAKVLHRTAGRPMIEYPVGLARALGSEKTVCVLGHQADAVRAAIEARYGEGAVEVAIQAEQKGTGHAVQQAAPLLESHNGLLLILYGDTPLLTEGTLERLIDTASAGILALVTFHPQSPRGYGRVVRNDAGKVTRIVEEKDCSDTERRIGECNAGIYCGPSRFILESLHALVPNNAQGELYLTDVVEMASHELAVATIDAPVEEVMGVNDRVDLARADRVMRLRLAEALMREGVTVRDPERLYLEPDIKVGRDTELGPGVELRGRTVVGEGCRIEQGVVLSDATVGDQVHIKPYCVITESQIGSGAQVGPWAHLRPGSVLEEEVHLGNFVETKKTRLGRGAKANHLTYLGDADVGAKVNIGCGTITCNYDGVNKNRTVIEDGAFIGSDTQLVAPVTVGKGAYVGSGSTIRKDVPAGALAVSAAPQRNIEGWAARRAGKQAPKPAATATATPASSEKRNGKPAGKVARASGKPAAKAARPNGKAAAKATRTNNKTPPKKKGKPQANKRGRSRARA
jgi:bifunctional UDP-N-acetylglucosamine pyrophosphorylase/glucosamine-1-phosphate N-acetyltransferase